MMQCLFFYCIIYLYVPTLIYQCQVGNYNFINKENIDALI